MTLETRHILVFSPAPETFKELCLSVRRQPWVEADVRHRECSWAGRDLKLEIDMVDQLEQVVEQLHTGYYNLLLVDCRHIPEHDIDHSKQEEAVHNFLDVLGNEKDIERRYPLRRVAVLVGDVDEERVDRFLFQMGKRHVGACLRDTSLSQRPVGGKKAARARFIEHIWNHCNRVMVRSRKGKKAISAAGGGITGIYYELGVLKCLHDAFDTGVHDFDMFLGISGGAVITSCLANGIPIDDLIAKIGHLDETWKYRLRLSWKQLNIAEVPRRVLLLQKEMVRYVMRMLKREDELSVASVFGLYAVLLGPIFDNNLFEKTIRRLFEKEGGTNDFRKLGPELYIGVTDQDRREHVLFGDAGYDDIPISRAVQASSAMHPFFPSVKINGRCYTDGIVTRTANLRAAIDHGADLVFIIDPFVPLISEEPGFNGRHGNMWIVEQDYKTMSYTRFSGAREEILRSDPDVNTYSFVPSNRMRRYMAKQNPFVSRNFNPIVCEAYRSTFRRLRQLEYKIRGELASHNINIDLGPVEEKVRRLKEAKRPQARLLLDGDPEGESNVA